MDLGSVGVFQFTRNATPEMAAELDKLGYGTIWLGGSPKGHLQDAEVLLEATERIVVASGIVNMWSDDAKTVSASYHRLEAKYPGRFLLGVGIGHPEHTEQYRSPYQTMVDYLDVCRGEGVPRERLVLAALGPKVLKLAAEQTWGAHPYLTTPSHTAEARRIIGGAALLAPEQKVVMDADPDRARALARKFLEVYLGLDNYRRNLLRSGFTEADINDGGSDAIVDALAVHGEPAAVAAGVRAHLDAGADHISVQVLGKDPMPGYRTLADLLL